MAPARKLFGTDGVRGVAGSFLSAELTLGIARAAAAGAGTERPRVLVIRDTRESGEMLEAAFAAGVAAAGGEALLGGVLPTPAAPLLLRRYGFDLAAVLSASHNPFQDNGIKLFGADGFKLTDSEEHAIEADLAEPKPHPHSPGRIRTFHNGLEDYLAVLLERFGELKLEGKQVVLDCANGATFQAAPELFRRLGATVHAIADDPDGRNINAGVGSTHMDAVKQAMADTQAEIGFAFDGDGDRLLAVDRHGVVVDGDELIALAARHLRAQGRLPGGGVAVTVMTNYGFHTAMREDDITVEVTKVGDRYVLEALRAKGWALGGEQSGHVIDLGTGPSGDGIAAALLCLEALGDEDLADRHAMVKLPQVLINVPVTDRDAVMASVELNQAAEQENAALDGRGRVLVRASGTEQLVRVMVEAPTSDEADSVCARLVDLAKSVH